MFKFLKLGLLGTALLFAQPSTAADLIPFNHDTLLLTHTHTHIAELRPAPDSYQLAKATFLPEASDEFGFSGSSLDNDHNQGDNCDGYPLSSCPTGGSCIKCPFNYKRFRVTGCQSPYIQSSGTCVCPAEKPLACPNDKCSKYCGSTCIEKTCTVTPNQSNCTNGTQACDDGCCGTKRQCCVPCTNKITSKPAYSSYTYSSCSDGSGSHSIQTGWTCNASYHQSGSTCEKDCIVQNCSGYSLSSCPSYGNCSSCTKTASSCSTNGTYYKLNSCQSGYSMSNGGCVEDDPWQSYTMSKWNTYCSYGEGCGGSAVCTCEDGTRTTVSTWLSGDASSVDEYSVESELDYSCDYFCN